MDITSHELKTMKVKQLRRIIREAIEQVLAENVAVKVTGASGRSSIESVPNIAAANDLKTKNTNIKSVVALEEDDLKEMAMGNKLADENMDLSQFANQMLSGKSLKDILTYVKENPGATEKQIADAFNFSRQQPINALMKALRDKNIVTRLDKSGEVIVPKAPGEEEDDEPVTGVDALFVGKGDSLAQYFDNEPNADGSEDITPENEPEKATYTKPTTSRSKAADFLLDNDRLIQKIINAQAASKLRVKEAAGDEGGLSSADVAAAERKRKETATSNLPSLISQLAEKIQAEDKDVQEAIIDMLGSKFASVGYTSLTKKIAQAVGTSAPTPAPEEEPETEDTKEDEIDALEEAAYNLRKLQFYAGIIK